MERAAVFIGTILGYIQRLTLFSGGVTIKPYCLVFYMINWKRGGLNFLYFIKKNVKLFIELFVFLVQYTAILMHCSALANPNSPLTPCQWL